MTTIVIVDDHRPFRRQARALLESEGFTVLGEAGDLAGGLAAVRSLAPAVVLVDVGLPGPDGIQLADRIATSIPAADRPAVVMTSSRDAASFAGRLPRASALGFIPKDELSGAAIRALLRGLPEARGE